MIIESDTEKAFAKIQQSFMIKNKSHQVINRVYLPQFGKQHIFTNYS